MGLLTPKQAHVRLEKQVSLNTIYQAIQERRLPHYRVSGGGKRGKILIDEADLLAWLDGCKVQAGPRPPHGRFTHRRP
jgi:excisionase family DNA binding protein